MIYLVCLQVRLADGSRIVVKLNQDHTVGNVKQENMSRQSQVRLMVHRIVIL